MKSCRGSLKCIQKQTVLNNRMRFYIEYAIIPFVESKNKMGQHNFICISAVRLLVDYEMVIRAVKIGVDVKYDANIKQNLPSRQIHLTTYNPIITHKYEPYYAFGLSLTMI